MPRGIATFLSLSVVLARCAVAGPAVHQVADLRITILSTMLAGDPLYKGIGEWGFSALVEVDGKRILFDTGLRPGTVLHNARELGIDLGDVEDVVLSHHHEDHVGGLIALRRAFMDKNPKAISRVVVAPAIFWSRGDGSSGGEEWNHMPRIRREYESLAGRFIEHTEPVELAPGVWFTGPVPRVHEERNWSGSGRVRSPDRGWTEDNIPESASLVINTPRGLVVLSGCGHAGIVNTIDYGREVARDPASPVLAVVGGFHLLSASDEHLAWTADKLEVHRVHEFLGAHCTGIEATYRLRELAGLDRRTAVVAGVGAVFDLKDGIYPGVLAK